MVSKTSTGLASIQVKLSHSLVPRTSDDGTRDTFGRAVFPKTLKYVIQHIHRYLGFPLSYVLSQSC